MKGDTFHAGGDGLGLLSYFLVILLVMVMAVVVTTGTVYCKLATVDTKDTHVRTQTKRHLQEMATLVGDCALGLEWFPVGM